MAIVIPALYALVNECGYARLLCLTCCASQPHDAVQCENRYRAARVVRWSVSSQVLVGGYAMNTVLRHARNAVLVVLVSGSLGACQSIMVHADGWGHPYAGTEKAVNFLADCGFAISMMGMLLPLPFVLLDIPLSFALDTLLLPADAIITSKDSRASVTRGPRCGSTL